MVVICEQVWREISNYLDGTVDPTLRAAMEEHIQSCQHCTSVLAGTRNVVQLYGDERLVRTPLGYSWRLRSKLAAKLPHPRGAAFGWLVAAAAAALIAGSMALANASPRSHVALLSEHAQPGQSIPDRLIVLVAGHSKVFHVVGCPFIHDKEAGIRTMDAEEAEREGYVPCVRCLGKYLTSVAQEFIRKHAWAGVLV